MKIGIISAMPVEMEKVAALLENKKETTISGCLIRTGTYGGKELICAVSGEGKVNAALCTQTLILLYKPDYIINLGVGGGVYDILRTGDIVIAEDVCQHDYNSMSRGYKRGELTNIDKIKIPCDKALSDALYNASLTCGKFKTYRGTVATGDLFVSEKNVADKIHDRFDAYVVEMEGASIGQVCYLNNVPFAVVRSVSDNGGDSAFSSFGEFLDYAVDNSVQMIKAFLDTYRG